MTDKPKVTQATDAAREAAAMYADADGEYYADPDDRAEYCRAVRAGERDADMLVQAFENLYRIAAEQSRDDVIEECVKVVDEHARIKRKYAHLFGDTAELAGQLKGSAGEFEALARTLRNFKGKKS